MSTLESDPFAHLDPQRRLAAQALLEKRREEAKEKEERARALLTQVTLEIERKKCDDFKYFISKAWSIIEPNNKLFWNWHLDELCNALTESALTPNFKGVINVPPGTMKSLLFVFFFAWLWRKNASLKFLRASYGGHLSEEHNVALRKIVLSSWYKELYPHVDLAYDVNKKQRFDTTLGGWSIATSVGGVGTGEHPDFVVVDDPLTEQQSRSKADRKSANDWLSGTISTRGIIHDVRFWLIMQRLHEEDPTGFLIQRGGLSAHIVLPMRFEGVLRSADGSEIFPDIRDHRAQVGELLWPEVFTEKKVEALELALGPRGVAGQLQQRPTSEGGNLFKREWFKIVDILPHDIYLSIRGWDTAATEGSGDYTAGVRLDFSRSGKIFITSVVREQTSDPDSLIEQTARVDGRSVRVREQREPGGSGKNVVLANAKRLNGFDYDGVPNSSDKVTNIRAFRSQAQAGNVFLLRGEWNTKYLDELCIFDNGTYDDQVDGTSTAYNASFEEKESVCTSATWGGKRWGRAS